MACPSVIHISHRINVAIEPAIIKEWLAGFWSVFKLFNVNINNTVVHESPLDSVILHE